MRKAVCGLLFVGAAALAQDTPAQNPAALDANADQAKAMVDALSQKLAHLNLVNPPAFKPSVCAIPLHEGSGARFDAQPVYQRTRDCARASRIPTA